MAESECFGDGFGWCQNEEQPRGFLVAFTLVQAHTRKGMTT